MQGVQLATGTEYALGYNHRLRRLLIFHELHSFFPIPAIPATRTKQLSAEIPKNVMAKETHEPHHSPSTKAVQTTGTVEQAAPDPAAVAPPPTHTHLSRKN